MAPEAAAPQDSAPDAAPEESAPEVVALDRTEVLGGRFQVKRSAFLGHGAYAVVRRGRDLETGRMVAVKAFRDDGDDGFGGSPSEEAVRLLTREVEALASLHHSTAAETRERLCLLEATHAEGGSAQLPDRRLLLSRGSFTQFAENDESEDILEGMRFDPKDLFVEVLSHSQGMDGLPGIQDGMCYVIQEFGLETLDHHLTDAREFESPMSVSQVYDVLTQITQVVASLHSLGLVHLDIKPGNLMRFKKGKRSIWKLIDMDGIQKTHSSVDPLTVPFTPLYCPPELARAVAAGESSVVVSRWMDIWSIGMCILDCMLPESLLSARFKQGQDAFLAWLGSINTIELPPEASSFDSPLTELLLCKVLRPEQSERASILELLAGIHRLPRPPARTAKKETKAKDTEPPAAPGPSAAEPSPLVDPAPPSAAPVLPSTRADPAMQAYAKRVFPMLVPLVRHLLVEEADDVEAEALRFLEARATAAAAASAAAR